MRELIKDCIQSAKEAPLLAAVTIVLVTGLLYAVASLVILMIFGV
jgi:hypothetical protein